VVLFVKFILMNAWKRKHFRRISGDSQSWDWQRRGYG
jgi:hypothetical protein